VRSVGVGRRFSRMVALPLVLLVGALTLTGCVRAHADLTISGDYKVSGTMVAATVPTSAGDQGPQLSIPADLGDQVLVQPYAADGYVGTQLSFSNLEFDQFTSLVGGSSAASGDYQLLLRRVGDLVSFTGTVDLRSMPADHADVQLRVTFPATVNSATGQVDDTTVTWQPKPGEVTSVSATSDLSTLATAVWMRWSVLVASLLCGSVLVISVLALRAHRRAVRTRR
jgi:LppM domain